MGEAIYLPGSMRVIPQLFAPKDRGLPSGLLDLGTRTGSAAGVPLVAWLIIHCGWRKMFLVVGFAALLWLPFWVLAVPSRLPGDKPYPSAQLVTQGLSVRGMIIDRNLLGCCL